jgi:hypothetical protein
MSIDDLPLDVIGTMAGTDKGSMRQGYLEHYEELFDGIRNSEFTLLEIGVADGASLETWKIYFPKARIIGVDITPTAVRFAGDRVVVEIGSQVDNDFMIGLCNKYQPSVIIDDGSHIAEHQISTFDTLFPRLPPGGLYICEDIHFHAQSALGGRHDVAAVNPIDYFLQIARRAVSAEGLDDQLSPAFRYAVHHVKQVRFFHGAVAVRKRGGMSQETILRNTVAVETLAHHHNTPKHWHWACLLIMANGGDIGRAESAIRRAIAGNADSSAFYRTLGRLLENAGDRDGSINALKMAVELDDRSGDQFQTVVSLEFLGDRFARLAYRDDARAAYLNARERLRRIANHQIRGHDALEERLDIKIASL